MSDLEKKIEALDILLRQVGDTPAMQTVRERAEDSGHLDDDWILALTTNAASEEERQFARRHVVFCDQCANLLLNRGGEADEGVVALDVPAPRIEPKRKNVRNDFLRVGVGLGIVVILSVIVYVVLPSWLRTEFADSNELESSKAPMTVGARGANVTEDGRLSLDRLAYMTLQPQEDRGEEYVYVLLVDANGDVSRLEPKSGLATRRLLSKTVELPNDFGGYDLKSNPQLAAGQRIGLFVYMNKTRIGLFEGEIFDRVTKQRIKNEAMTEPIPLNEASFRALTAKMRKLGFPGRVFSTSVRLIP